MEINAIKVDPNAKKISSLIHSTHYEEMISICQGNMAVFKGNPKQWCSYPPSILGNPDDPKKGIPISQYDSECLPGPLLWFDATKPNECEESIYGPFVFEFNFSAVIEAYQVCRMINSEQVCY